MNQNTDVEITPLGWLLAIPMLVSWALWDGLVAWLGLNWFIVPAFGLEPIGFWMAFGIVIFVAWIATDTPRNTPDDVADWMRRIFTRQAMVMVTLWLVHFLV